MKEEYFTNMKELYNRLLPALRSKKDQMVREGYLFTTEINIWKALYSSKWKQSTRLTLADMVDDILNTNSLTIYRNIRKEQ